MNNEENRRQPNAPVTDSEGKPVDVVERDIEQPDSDTDDVDKLITPTSIKRKEQDVETLERANREVERRL
ncbi:hypothetical protein [Pseudomonas massiliensis]|uniref:hypothetical protein n=1 Tax=Pseudomonas massiliensis TaxID=522492 RepID=UPI00058C4DAD|nr:hypothetical protein [Pseudomonas massiliensis]